MIVIRLRDSYVVLSQAGHVYVVDPSIPACSCPAFVIEGKECKHIKAVRIKLAEGGIIEDEEEALRVLKSAFIGEQ